MKLFKSARPHVFGIICAGVLCVCILFSYARGVDDALDRVTGFCDDKVSFMIDDTIYMCHSIPPGGRQ